MSLAPPNPPIRVPLSPRATEIEVAARDLLETEGPAAVSMRNIAARLGIRAASLYEHFADKRAVENAVIASGLFDQGDYVAAQLVASADARLPAIARAYREFALAHPALYQLIMARDLDRAAPNIASAEAHAATPLRREVGDHLEFYFSFWAFAHGMVDLELCDRFPPGFDVDVAWAAGIDALTGALERARRQSA